MSSTIDSSGINGRVGIAMMNAVDGGSSPVPQFPRTPPVRARRRFLPAACRVALLLLFPAAALAQEEFDPPLITAEERRAFEDTQRRQYPSALQADNPSPDEQLVLKEGARYYLYGLTMVELRKDLPDVIDDMTNDLYTGLCTENARRIVCQEIVDRAVELLPPQPNETGENLNPNRLGQPHVVRMNLAIMLRRLNIRPPEGQRGAIPFVPARTPLLMILSDPGNTRMEARYWAAEGLGRICETAVPGVTDGDLQLVPRSEIGVALANAMQHPATKDDQTRFLPMQIMDSLGDCGLSRDAVGSALIIETLASCLANTEESDLVRSTAALSISRLGRINEANGLGAGVNFPLIISETMKYGREVAAELQAGNGNIHSRRALINLYFAFEGERPITAEEQRIGFNHQVLRAGLGQHSALVQSAYTAILPVFQEVASNPNPNITPAMVQALDTWIAGNEVTDRKITPESEPLPEPAAPAANPPADPCPCPAPETEEP
jgi:hypothetical protein